MKTAPVPDLASAYWKDGYAFPLPVFSDEEVAAARSAFEEFEDLLTRRVLPDHPAAYLRTNVEVLLPTADRIARDPRVLDAVEQVLGPDIMVWSSEFFVKEPHSDKIVSWHQDLTYWGLGETDGEVTAWIALSPVTRENGCMRFVPGSHETAIVPHYDTFAEDNLLSRGQEIAVEVDESNAVNVELQPGEMSLHHGRMFHASGPNESNERRIALVIRYVKPQVRQHVADKDYAMLVRGANREQNFIDFCAPANILSDEGLALRDEIMRERDKAYGEGCAEPITYANSA